MVFDLSLCLANNSQSAAYYREKAIQLLFNQRNSIISYMLAGTLLLVHLVIDKKYPILSLDYYHVYIVLGTFSSCHLLNGWLKCHDWFRWRLEMSRGFAGKDM